MNKSSKKKNTIELSQITVIFFYLQHAVFLKWDNLPFEINFEPNSSTHIVVPN